MPEVQIQQPGYNIIRRRIAIVLGQWLPVKEYLDRALVYQIFQYLLNRDDTLNDVVVRVTGGRQLKNVIDPFGFTPEGFLPYAQPILSGVMSLIQEVELGETKMALLNTISVIVVRMQQHVSYGLPHYMAVLTNCRSPLLQTRSCLFSRRYGNRQGKNI